MISTEKALIRVVSNVCVRLNPILGMKDSPFSKWTARVITQAFKDSYESYERKEELVRWAIKTTAQLNNRFEVPDWFPEFRGTCRKEAKDCGGWPAVLAREISRAYCSLISSFNSNVDRDLNSILAALAAEGRVRLGSIRSIYDVFKYVEFWAYDNESSLIQEENDEKVDYFEIAKP